MNLRQKRKHYLYSFRFFMAWFNKHDENFSLSCNKKYRKALKQKLRVKEEYDYDKCCRKYWFCDEYCGDMPKFMREKGRKNER
ncbi:hypothetical protein [Streptococcus sp. AM43-2AT]|uniref:hypothetical protein n=1 Tax=Streptococcus sp. AM43-2AT TaxID=2293247 RepID=UPI000ED1BE3D|nr:hypothetical protein [Streptococcus sp. AM43-2AT]RJU23434.1 hypothetical protein DW930_09120 [Streptococcus sp. AM43-2AT]